MSGTKIRGLQHWCRRVTDGYPHVDIDNFTTAWRDGMAFCAIIHRFRPDLIDYDSLSPANVYQNCKLAFEVAERELDIPAFLDAEDMAKLKAPDKLSVITYVSEYYNSLSPLPQMGGPGVRSLVSNIHASGTKRLTQLDDSYAPATKRAPVRVAKENAVPTVEKSKLTPSGDKCAICQSRVYLLERHIEAGKLYHRSCFRHSELSPTNKVYTRSPFLSPSLSSETSHFTFPNIDTSVTSLPDTRASTTDTKTNSHLATEIKTTSSVTALSDTRPSHMDSKYNRHTSAELKATSAASSTPTKSEGVGMKHLLNEPTREDTKKSKLQPGISLDEEKSKKAAAIRDRLQNLKDKYIFSKSTPADNALPLSSKEARKLEKKQDILTPAKLPEGSPQNTQQNVSLVSHHNKKAVSNHSKGELAGAASAVSLLTSVTSSKSAALLLPTSGTLITSKSDSTDASSKSKVAGDKSSENSTEDKPNSALDFKNKAQDLSLTISATSDLSSEKPSRPQHPVARPRTVTVKSDGMGSNQDNISTRPSEISTDEKNRDIPKPAPRKSMVEITEKKAPERPKLPPQSNKYTAHSSLTVDQVDSSRTSASPPPPPLPSSAPPQLPSASPTGNIASSLSNRDSEKPSAEVILREAKSSLRPRTQIEDSQKVSANVGYLQSKMGLDTSRTMSNRISIASVPGHANIKSEPTTDCAVVTRVGSLSKPQDRRWSAPLFTDRMHGGFNDSPSENKASGQILSGLLSSLAVVRDRRSSSQGSSDLSLSPSSLSPSPTSVSEKLPPLSETNSDVSVKPASESAADKITESSTLPSSNILSPHKEPMDASAVITSSQQISNSKIRLSSLKKLNSESTKTDFYPSTDLLGTGVNELSVCHLKDIKSDDNSESADSLKLTTSAAAVKSESQDIRDISKLNNFTPVSAEQQTSSIESKSLTSMNQIVFSSKQEDIDASNSNIKLDLTSENKIINDTESTTRVDTIKIVDIESNMQLDKKYADRYIEEKVIKDSEATTMADSVKNVDTKSDTMPDTTPQKPPKLSKISKALNHKNLRDFKVGGKESVNKQIHISTASTEPTTTEEITMDSPAEKLQTAAEKAGGSEKLPQWKKDIEERRKKLREDIARSENESITLKHLRRKEMRNEPMPQKDVSEIQHPVKPILEKLTPNPTAFLENEPANNGETRVNKLLQDFSSHESEDKTFTYVELNTDDSNKNNVDEVDEVPSKIQYNVNSFHNQARTLLKESSLIGDKYHKDVTDDLSQVGDKTKELFSEDVSQTDDKMQKLNSFSNDISQKSDRTQEFNFFSEDKSQISDKTQEEKILSENLSMKSGQTPENVSPSDSMLHICNEKQKDVKFDVKMPQMNDRTQEDISTLGGLSQNSDNKNDCVSYFDILMAGSNDVTTNKQTFNVELDGNINAQMKELDFTAEEIMQNSEETDNNFLIEEPSDQCQSKKFLDERDKDVIHHLTPVSEDNDEKINLKAHKDNTQEDDTKLSNSLLSTKSLPSESVNEVEHSGLADTEHVQMRGMKSEASVALIRLSDLQESEDSGNDIVKERRISQLSEHKLVLENVSNNSGKDISPSSPKARRKITVIGKNSKDSVKTLQATPLPMKKIEVITKFDFDKSSDFEQSLTDSAAKLTIRDKHVPPPRPPPPHLHHKTVSPLQISAIELHQQLLDIDSRLTNLELKGRELEDSIRSESTLEEDDDSLINEWFSLVSEKNELVRKEADLAYISRQQDLEDEQAHIESQLRYLISKPEDCKSLKEKQEEAYLIKRKLELVEERNTIIDSMDEDRIRYETEDKNIKVMKDKGLWRNSTGSSNTAKGKQIKKSVFYS